MTILEKLTILTRNAYGSTEVLSVYHIDELLPNILHKMEANPNPAISELNVGKPASDYPEFLYRAIYDDIIAPYVLVYLQKNYPSFLGIPLYYPKKQKLRLGIPID